MIMVLLNIFKLTLFNPYKFKIKKKKLFSMLCATKREANKKLHIYKMSVTKMKMLIWINKNIWKCKIQIKKFT